MTHTWFRPLSACSHGENSTHITRQPEESINYWETRPSALRMSHESPLAAWICPGLSHCSSHYDWQLNRGFQLGDAKFDSIISSSSHYPI